MLQTQCVSQTSALHKWIQAQLDARALAFASADLQRVHLLQGGGVTCENLNAESGRWMQVAAGIAFQAQLSQLSQLLQGCQILHDSQPETQARLDAANTTRLNMR